MEQKLPKIFFIADTHFGHTNIIRMCARPFADTADMQQQMIEKWNAKVGKDDVVYLLGDVSFKINKFDTAKILAQLNGHKILIKGNHDKYVGQPEFDQYFDDICETAHFTTANGEEIFLCHYPILDYPGAYRNGHMIYGHVHNQYVPYERMYCVSAECVNYEPVTFDEIKAIYDEKPKEERIPWLKPF